MGKLLLKPMLNLIALSLKFLKIFFNKFKECDIIKNENWKLKYIWNHTNIKFFVKHRHNIIK